MDLERENARLRSALAAAEEESQKWCDEATTLKHDVAAAETERDEARIRLATSICNADIAERRAEAAEDRLANATKFCTGEWPCEASTAAASLERERNDALRELDVLRQDHPCNHHGPLMSRLERAEARCETLRAQLHGMQDGALVRDLQARVRELEAGVAATINMNERETLQWWAAQSNDHLAKLRTSEARCARLEGERDRLQHTIDCANTPLMRDVLAERDALAQQLQRVRDALAKTARFNQPVTDPKHSNLWPCWCSQERYGYICRGVIGHDDNCTAAREALAALPPKD